MSSEVISVAAGVLKRSWTQPLTPRRRFMVALCLQRSEPSVGDALCLMHFYRGANTRFPNKLSRKVFLPAEDLRLKKTDQRHVAQVSMQYKPYGRVALLKPGTYTAGAEGHHSK